MPDAPAFADAAAQWNRRFQQEGFLFGTEPNAWLREQAGALPAGGRVLSVADGEGRNSVWLAQRGFRVDAFDIAESGVAKARALAARQGVAVDYQVADAEGLPGLTMRRIADAEGFAWPEGAYDGVAAIFIQFADPPLRERLFARIVSSLRPGGVLILQGYTPEQLTHRTGGPPFASHLYTEDLLRAAFADLRILTLRTYEAELREGSGHHGRSALIGLVAQR